VAWRPRKLPRTPDSALDGRLPTCPKRPPESNAPGAGFPARRTPRNQTVLFLLATVSCPRPNSFETHLGGEGLNPFGKGTGKAAAARTGAPPATAPTPAVPTATTPTAPAFASFLPSTKGEGCLSLHQRGGFSSQRRWIFFPRAERRVGSFSVSPRGRGGRAIGKGKSFLFSCDIGRSL